MRHSNQSTGGLRRPARGSRHAAPTLSLVVFALVTMIAVGCGPAAVASTSPTPQPTPVVTPDPHLKVPVTADQVYTAIASAHLKLYPNNATTSEGTITKRINADLEGWTLRITAYTTHAAMEQAKTWKAGGAMVRGDAPYNFAALNVIVEFGPTTRAAAPAPPDVAHQATAATIMAILDPLLWPIEQHSVMAIPSMTIPPAPPSAAPSKPPKATPKPSAKPSKAP